MICGSHISHQHLFSSYLCRFKTAQISWPFFFSTGAAVAGDDCPFSANYHLKESSGNICINKENECQLHILLPESSLTKVDINIQDEKMNFERDFPPCGIPTSHSHIPANLNCISSASS